MESARTFSVSNVMQTYPGLREMPAFLVAEFAWAMGYWQAAKERTPRGQKYDYRPPASWWNEWFQVCICMWTLLCLQDVVVDRMQDGRVSGSVCADCVVPGRCVWSWAADCLHDAP